MFTIPTALHKAIADDNLVFFVGSGFSSGLGFPDWKGLVKKIINTLKEKGHDYDEFLAVLEKGSMSEIDILEIIKSHKGIICDVLEETFELSDATKKKIKEQEKFAVLWQASSKIITTNYDRVLETAGDLKASEVVTHETKNTIKNLSNKERFLFKIHGDLADSANCVLFRSGYQKLYGKENSPILELKKFISDKVILFIGFSMADPFVTNLFSYIKELYDELKGNPHFIVTTKNDDFSDYGVEQIKLNDFVELPSLLKEIASLKEQRVPLTLKVDSTKKIKAAVLTANPIVANYDYGSQIKALKKLNINLDFYHLCYETLNNLNDYGYLFVFTKQIKNKIVIEDEYLDQHLITLKEIEDNIGNSDTRALFLFLDKVIELQKEEGLILPIIIYPELSKPQMQKVLFEAFNKKFQPCPVEGYQVINGSEIRFEKLIDKPISYQVSTRLPDEIDKKTTVNFVGRITDLKNITREIIDLQGEGGVLTIKGSGGIGKTHTIKKVVVNLAGRNYFKDGIDFVDCEFITDYKLFEFRVLNIFNLELSQDPVSYLRDNQIDKDVLIILDNFETMLHLDDKEQIVSFLSFICEYATIVVTSRELLDLEWESPYELRSMSTDEATLLFKAGMVNRSWGKSEEKFLREDIIENLLDNNPLAITLITKNLPKSKSLEALKSELEDDIFNKVSDVDLKAFDSGSDMNIERKRSLYSSINFSYRLLNAKEKLAFELVSLFPDGVDIENLKRISQEERNKLRNSKENKMSDLGITDRVICNLEKKSMLESNNNTVKLQSIIGKFAEQKLSQRDNMSVIYRNAFEYNNAVVKVWENIKEKDSFLSDKLFSGMQNNFLKSIEYIDRFDYEKKDIILYLDTLSTPFISFCAIKNFIKVMENKSTFFSGNEKILFDVIIICSKYFDGQFDESLADLQKLIPIAELNNFNYSDKIESLIVNTSMNLYSMEGNSLMCAEYYSNNKIKIKDFTSTMFYIGEYNPVFNRRENRDFFRFEIDNNVGKLNLEELDIRLNKLHKKRHLEIMELYYLKAKLGEYDYNVIKKLVVVNPFTLGLKRLIFAFNETIDIKARTLYEKAISDLRHIKYYYIEAHYFYAKFLKEIDDQYLYEEIYNKGFGLAQKYHYRFLIYKFECFVSTKHVPYDSKNYPLPNDVSFDKYFEL